MVFFDDDRFFLSDASDCDMLRDRLRERVGGSPDKVTMLLMADKQIRHSDLVRFSGLAKEAGIERLSIAVKPE
jgi:biopolymer transport protein ExbD